ncbi:hypothetical protein KI387_011803, partial [Taxus chinensis]
QPPYNDQEIANGTKATFRRPFPDPVVASVVRYEMGTFVSTSNGTMGEIEAFCDKYNVTPIMWWYVHGHDAKYLRPVAIKILSQ